jgi:hypothetical protein
MGIRKKTRKATLRESNVVCECQVFGQFLDMFILILSVVLLGLFEVEVYHRTYKGIKTTVTFVGPGCAVDRSLRVGFGASSASNLGIEAFLPVLAAIRVIDFGVRPFAGFAPSVVMSEFGSFGPRIIALSGFPPISYP